MTIEHRNYPADHPADMEAEWAVLGCCLLDQKCIPIMLDILVENDFFHPPHRYIFRAISKLFVNGMRVDYITLTDVLIKNKMLDRAGGPDYLCGLTNTVPSVRSVTQYSNIVYEKACFRNVMKYGTEITEMAKAGKSKVNEIIDYGMGKLIDIQKGRVKTDIKPLKDAMWEYILEQGEKADQGIVPGLNLGIRGIDECVGGLQEGEVCILASRPSVGKTALACTIADHLSREGRRVLLVSAEMTWKSLAARYISMATGENLYDIRTGTTIVRAMEHEGLSQMMEREKQILIYHTYKPTDMSIRTSIQLAIHKYGRLDLVIIDYLQLIRSSNPDLKNDNQKLEDISANFKAMALEPMINCPFLILSQLSRGSAKEERRPRLDDLRGSGAIEQDADVVVLLYKRPQENRSDVHFVEYDVAKNRQGRVSIRENVLKFHRKVVTFEDSNNAERINYFDNQGSSR